MRLGITEFVDCAHFLPGHLKCGQIHGHTYTVEVMMAAPAPGLPAAHPGVGGERQWAEM